MVQLRVLGLQTTNITDTALQYLPNRKRITRLFIDGTRVTDGGIVFLTEAEAIEFLGISDTAVTDSAVPVLTGFKRLKKMWIRGTNITKEGILALEQCVPECAVAQ